MFKWLQNANSDITRKIKVKIGRFRTPIIRGIVTLWNGKVKAASPMLTSASVTIIGVSRLISDESGVRWCSHRQTPHTAFSQKKTGRSDYASRNGK